MTGFEPVASTLARLRSDQLSYIHKLHNSIRLETPRAARPPRGVLCALRRTGGVGGIRTHGETSAPHLLSREDQ